MRTTLWTLAFVLMLVPPVLAQNPTGTLTGTVTDDQSAGLPGVTVTATSPSLQGERTTQSGSNGGYRIGTMPAGEYRVTYELEGFATKVRTVKISAAQTLKSDIDMQIAEVVEEIVVTSNVETISETNTVASTYTGTEVEELPVARTIYQTVQLAPGVHNTAVGGNRNISINGAMSFENVWMINGVVINENVRGQSLPLFVEDAVSETTVQTAGVSAEYGRFTGGVVNVITKSGGNELSGSIRVNLNNDDWESQTPLSGDRVDDITQTYEGTLGGPFWKDKIWFFASYRDLELADTRQTAAPTNATFPSDDLETRLEGKLTITPHPSHQVQVSYLDLERTRTNTGFGPVRQIDFESFSPNRTDPQEITAANYTGILTPSFFVEAQYSEREYAIGVGSGGPSGDLINGSFIRSRGGNAGRVQYAAPFFCADCETEIRNNDNTLIKGSYFLTSESAGSHDIAFGYDTFTDIRFSVNHQTGSDFQVWSDDLVIDGPSRDQIYPVLSSGGRAWLVWWPPDNLDIAAPTDFVTNSFYVNDSWQLNDKWSFNIGVRYDENDGTDSGGATTVDDSKVSPRLGFSYDVKGDGDLVINGSYGTYVAAIANSRADSASQGGQLAGFGFAYTGPAINQNCQPGGAGCTGTDAALNQIFDWYFANGGADDIDVARNNLSQLPNLIFACFPGVTSVVPDTLKSPAAEELTIGVTKRLGSKGLFRADVIFREWEDFYSDKTDINSPFQAAAVEGFADVNLVGNFGDDQLKREYLGVNVMGRYRFGDKFTLAGTYTWSELEGNINGETAGSGPTPLSPAVYPEYKAFPQNNPVGPLLADQTHKFRIWGIYDLINNENHALSLSLLQNFFSGQPYSAAGNIDNRSFVNNPGYFNPPSTVNYFFGPRGRFETDDITRTDLGLNYAFRWNAFGKSMEVFIQPEVINLFNEDGIEIVNSSVDTEDNANLALFNPFTDTPVEGVNWDKGVNFGQPLDEDDYQQPRIYRVSIGFRF